MNPVDDVRALSPDITLTEMDKVKLRLLGSVLVDGCALCGIPTTQVIRLRMKGMPTTMLAPLCADHAPRVDATDAEIDQLEERLLQPCEPSDG